MDQKRHLKPADELLAPVVARSVEALGLRPEDEAVAALAVLLARSLDEMDADTRGRMIGQTSGALLKVLQELEVRARAGRRPRPPSRLDELRAARAADARRP